MPNYYLVAPTVVVRGDKSAFTYHSAADLPVGSVVKIPVGRKLLSGVVLKKFKTKPSFTTKPVDKLILDKPLPLPLLNLAQWLSDYYATHLSFSLQAIMPSNLEKSRRDLKKVTHPSRLRTNILLNSAQEQVLKSIQQSPSPSTFLLHGVTGSGKTQIYIEAAKNQAAQGKSAIILVPEIALTPQLVAEFANHFSSLIITHSGLTEAQRFAAWSQALNTNDPTIVIGPRSALFLPIKNVGLIVVDECHEQTYKQEQSPRYLALRAASVLAKSHGAKLILGSATPNTTDYYLASSAKQPILSLPAPIAKTKNVNIQIVDYKKRDNFKKHRFISDKLLSLAEQALANKKQVLLFHNRRGTAPNTICGSCGWIANCQKCFLPLTLHADHHKLVCHLCGAWANVTPSCPVCHQPTIVFKGVGTKMIESEVAKLFPKASIARFDADSKQKDTLQSRYQEVYNGEIDIIIGTQILTKGLDLPNLTVVGVIQADSGLLLPDYQTNERVFQLIYQVMGRVGRADHDGQVVVQTFQPDHPVINFAVKRSYQSFYQAELAARKKGKFPPFSYLLKLTCTYKTEKSAISASQKLAQQLRKNKQVEILGPTPAFYERLGGNFRWQIIVKAKKRSELVDIARQLPTGWQFDLDPISLL